MKILQKSLLSGLVACTLSTAAGAIDKAESSNGAQVFEPAYFESYAPRTALDMIGRIPGFQLQFGDNKRGLGNGGANILINGERISGKTNPRDQLSRITAKNVVKIEIVDGTSLDIPGLTGQVANVFTKTTGITGTWEWKPEWRNRLKPSLFRGAVTVSGQRGNLSYSAKLKNDTFRNGNWGPEELFSPDGVVFETRDESSRFNGDNPGGSLNLTWKPKEDHIANLNLEYNQFNFNGREISKRTAITARGTTQETLFSRAEDEWNAEAGGDYEFPAGPGKLKFIGYYRFEHSPTVSRFDIFDPVLGRTDGSRFFRIADEAEMIGRAEYSLNTGEGEDWQLGIEGAFNFLDIESSLLVLDNGVFVEEALDGASSRVEENRAEATLTHSHNFSPKLKLQASAGVEYSQLSQTGAEGQVRSFVRPKGFVSTTYKPDDSLDIRFKIEREVGQLNFFDFISSVSVQDDFDTAGNANIVPEQSWLAEVEFDKKFGKGNTFKARFYGAKISDLVDRIPIGDGDAVGNIDSASRYGFDLSSTVKGDKWGLKGTELELEYQWRKSSVDDPLLGFARRLNGDKISYWSVSFRHDIPKTDWAWGFYSDQFLDAPSYRLSTINSFDFNGPWSQLFIGHKDIYGMKIRGTLKNFFNASDDFTREIYTDRRDLGVVDFTEQRTRPFGMFFQLDISGTF